MLAHHLQRQCSDMPDCLAAQSLAWLVAVAAGEAVPWLDARQPTWNNIVSGRAVTTTTLTRIQAWVLHSQKFKPLKMLKYAYKLELGSERDKYNSPLKKFNSRRILPGPLDIFLSVSRGVLNHFHWVCLCSWSNYSLTFHRSHTPINAQWPLTIQAGWCCPCCCHDCTPSLPRTPVCPATPMSGTVEYTSNCTSCQLGRNKENAIPVRCTVDSQLTKCKKQNSNCLVTMTSTNSSYDRIWQIPQLWKKKCWAELIKIGLVHESLFRVTWQVLRTNACWTCIRLTGCTCTVECLWLIPPRTCSLILFHVIADDRYFTELLMAGKFPPHDWSRNDSAD